MKYLKPIVYDHFDWFIGMQNQTLKIDDSQLEVTWADEKHEEHGFYVAQSLLEGKYVGPFSVLRETRNQDKATNELNSFCSN